MLIRSFLLGTFFTLGLGHPLCGQTRPLKFGGATAPAYAHPLIPQTPVKSPSPQKKSLTTPGPRFMLRTAGQPDRELEVVDQNDFLQGAAFVDVRDVLTHQVFTLPGKMVKLLVEKRPPSSNATTQPSPQPPTTQNTSIAPVQALEPKMPDLGALPPAKKPTTESTVSSPLTHEKDKTPVLIPEVSQAPEAPLAPIPVANKEPKTELVSPNVPAVQERGNEVKVQHSLLPEPTLRTPKVQDPLFSSSSKLVDQSSRVRPDSTKTTEPEKNRVSTGTAMPMPVREPVEKKVEAPKNFMTTPVPSMPTSPSDTPKTKTLTPQKEAAVIIPVVQPKPELKFKVEPDDFHSADKVKAPASNTKPLEDSSPSKSLQPTNSQDMVKPAASKSEEFHSMEPIKKVSLQLPQPDVREFPAVPEMVNQQISFRVVEKMGEKNHTVIVPLGQKSTTELPKILEIRSSGPAEANRTITIQLNLWRPGEDEKK